MPSEDPSTDDSDAQPTGISETMRTVDLTDGEPPTETPSEQDGETSGTDEFDAEAEGEREARRKLQAADGDTEGEVLENAIADLRENFESLAQQRQQARQRREQLATQREQFNATRERLEAIHGDDEDDRRVTQDLAGGITVDVPHEELPGLIDKIDARREEYAEESENLDTQLGQIERAVAKVQAALSELQRKKAAFDEVEQTKKDMQGSLN